MSEQAMEAQEVNEVQDVQENNEVQESEIQNALEGAVESQGNEPLTKSEIKEIQRILELKMDGEDRKLNLDDEKDLNELKRLAQMGGVGQKRMQEAAEMRKQVDFLLSELKSNPRAVLADFGIDVNKFAEGIIEEEIEQLKKSPEQIEMERIRKELDEKDRRLKQIAQEKEEAEFARYQESVAQELDKEITNALANEPDLPKSGYSIKRIADTMLWAMQNGHHDIKVKDVIPHVKRQINDEIRQLLESLPEDIVEKYIGDNVSTKLRKRRIEKAKTPTVATKKIESTGAEVKKKEEAKPVEKMTMREFLYGKE